MAIQDTPTSGQSNFAAAGSTAPPATASSGAPFQQAGTAGTFSLLNLGNVGGIARSATSEVLAKSYEATTKTIQESRISQAYKVHVVQIDNQIEKRLRLSSLVLAVRHEASGTVAHHALMLEGSADPLPPKIDTINGVQVQIDNFASRVYDAIYAAAVDQVVATAFPNSKIINTAGTVVPRIFDWADREAVRELVQNAMVATVTYLEARLPDFVDLDMSKMQSDATLQVQTSYDNPQRTDYTGLPIRSDIQVLTSAVANQRQDASGSLNNQTEAVTVSRLTGYVDLTYSPPQNQQAYGQGYQVQGTVGLKRCYNARFIITQMENALRLTPAAQLLALATGMTLAEGTSYFRAFKPNMNAKSPDPRDIGAVNIEANLQDDPSGFGKPIDTKAANFGDRELGALIQATIHPGLAICVDVSDAGADTWYNRQFARASMGDPEANKEILRAANVLTGGNFGQLYGNSNFPAVMVTDELVLMGYYIDSNGQRADIRNVDYLAVLNLHGVKNPQAVADWSDTFERADMPQALRLQGRKTIIRSIAEQVTFTQHATRATFNPDFLKMLVQALLACNVTFKPVNVGISGDYLISRAGGRFAGAALGMGVSGLFTQGGITAAPSFQRPFMGQSMF